MGLPGIAREVGLHNIRVREDADGRRLRPAPRDRRAAGGDRQQRRLTPRHSGPSRGEEEYDGCIHHSDRYCLWIVSHMGGSGAACGLKSAFNLSLREM